MRILRDGSGRVWDVVLGRESWGATVVLFVCRSPGAGVRQAPLVATSRVGAAMELEDIDDEQLAELLSNAEPKSP